MKNHKGKILIVDDDARNIGVLATILSENGYTVEYALNGPNALAIEASQIFDLILLDIVMPKMNGFEVCQKIENNSETPVIFLTAEADIESIENAFEVGGVDYIRKPFATSELLARVRTHIKLKKVNTWLANEVALRTKELEATNLQLQQEIKEHLRTSKILQQSERQLVESRLKALQTQMNPHFIFNILNCMQSILFLKDSIEANKTFVLFSKLIRFTLDMSRSNYILLEDEIKYLQSYIGLEKMRLDIDIDNHIHIAPSLNPKEVKIPCMFFQPLVENAIIHGLRPKMNSKTLRIDIKKEGEFLKAEIVDNGVGREASTIKTQTRTNQMSWAGKIMNDRIQTYNERNKDKISLEIIDLVENNTVLGTKVCLAIPLHLDYS